MATFSGFRSALEIVVGPCGLLAGLAVLAAGCGGSPPGTVEVVASGAVVLAPGQQSPIAIAIDGTNVYWMNLGTNATTDPKAPAPWMGGQVMKCPIAGCDGTPISLASDRMLGFAQREPPAFATDGTNVYWSDDTTSPAILKCAVGGCDGGPQAVSNQGAESLAVYQGSIYWTEFAAEVFACPISGCSAGQTMPWSAGDSPCAVGIAVDGTGIYWATTAPDAVLACALGGCDGTPSSVMASSPSAAAVSQVALDDNNVYFTDANPQIGMILACAKSGCGSSPTVLASGLNAPMGIVTDGLSVYWTETGNGVGAGLVRKCSVTGCANVPTNIATGLNGPVGIAVDDRYVYWTETGTSAADGKVWMAPK
ncbi:MAG TPA: hypothetical protein VLC06_02670 [Polyangia bacterium]|nr:hypothetical protein [Polyangia bacterium]